MSIWRKPAFSTSAANAARSAVLARLRAAQAPYVLVYNRHARHPCVSVDGRAIVVNLARPREDNRGSGGYSANGYGGNKRSDVGYGSGGFGGGRY